MKIQVLCGSIAGNGVNAVVGDFLDVSEAEAKRLADLGVAKIADEKKAEDNADEKPKSKAEKESK